MKRTQDILTKANRSKSEAEIMQKENENENENKQETLMSDCRKPRKQSAQLDKHLSTMKQTQQRQKKDLLQKINKINKSFKSKSNSRKQPSNC